MTDAGGAVLLFSTAAVLVMVALATPTANRQGRWAFFSMLMLIGSVLAVGCIYLAFAVNVDAGVLFRPYLKIAAGVFAGLWATGVTFAHGWRPR